MILPSSGHDSFLLEALQFLRSYFEHVTLDIEQIVALGILKVVDLLVVTHLQGFRPVLDFDQLQQPFSHSLSHFLPCLQRQVDKQGIVLYP